MRKRESEVEEVVDGEERVSNEKDEEYTMKI